MSDKVDMVKLAHEVCGVPAERPPAEWAVRAQVAVRNYRREVGAVESDYWPTSIARIIEREAPVTELCAVLEEARRLLEKWELATRSHPVGFLSERRDTERALEQAEAALKKLRGI